MDTAQGAALPRTVIPCAGSPSEEGRRSQSHSPRPRQPSKVIALSESTLNYGQIPIDQRTAFIAVLACLTTAVVLPPDQRQSLIDLLNLALQLYGRR